jgi:signal transduction histidine kinase
VREGVYTGLQVADKGVGISAEDIHRVFELYYTKKKMGRNGTGLGMVVVWGTVEGHGGYIGIQSARGRRRWLPCICPASASRGPLRLGLASWINIEVEVKPFW